MKDVIEKMAEKAVIDNLKEALKTAVAGPLDPRFIEYDELKTALHKITPDAGKLIGIVENESDDMERRIAFLETTKNELLAGADYSGCETIKDMAAVYARSLVRRLGL